MYIAHIDETTGEKQSVKEHNENVATLCANFAIPELKEICFATGLLHDCGKYSNAFQRRIRGEDIKVDHSTAGAVIASEIYNSPISETIELCVSGHHSGIPDMGIDADSVREDISANLRTRIAQKKKRCEKNPDERFDEYASEIALPEVDAKKLVEFIAKDCTTQDDMIDKLSFINRYCFSCLVDADSIDTAEFCGTRNENQLYADFSKCLGNINLYLDGFVGETELQKARRRLQEQALSKVNQDADIYLMNMPTGSGKTLCSVKFALRRAILKGKKRIIYVIPYNSIIDQTAKEFDNVFSEDAQILRHQSSFSYEDTEDIDEDYKNAIRNGTENWDVPFIITTAVQFFESLHSNKRSKLRKLHNIADSIIVFDEAHLMPMSYLQPCLQAVSYVTKYLNSEALFLTATMPDFRELLCKYTLTNEKVLELIDDTSDFKLFEKCEFKSMGEVSAEMLLGKVAEAPSALVVLNSKRSARRLYEFASGDKYCLSTYLTSADRERIIEEIKTKLEELEKDFPKLENVPDERKVRIFSTSLIEAGVDIDLASVFRESTGLDSILQSGGRCNREGKRENAVTYIFSISDENLKTRETERSELAKGMFDKYERITNPDCIKEYYNRLFGMNQEKITGKTMSAYCKERNFGWKNIPFRSYAEDFRFIDDKMESIVVPIDEKSRELINNLKYQEYINTRSLQKYTCSVSKSELEELIKQHVIDDYGRGVWCLTNENYYDEKTGICFELTDYFL